MGTRVSIDVKTAGRRKRNDYKKQSECRIITRINNELDHLVRTNSYQLAADESTAKGAKNAKRSIIYNKT